ncbi:MAG: hypothetical protein JRJ84_15685 [Deltaproteobacteria bacterium]|nr:hypothetical protein [Deltaproteobacteria bacterium]
MRSTLGDIFLAPALDRAIRRRVEEILAARDDRIDQLEARLGARGDGDRVVQLEKEVASLKKKLGVAMGTLQATAADLVALRAVSDEAATSASQARQNATSALSTAESAADGITALEDQVATLWKELDSGTSVGSAKAAPPKRKRTKKKPVHPK